MTAGACLQDLLWDAPEHVWLVPSDRDIHRAGEARSHLADGRLIVWRPAPQEPATRFAVDAELSDRSPPAALSKKLAAAGGDFWRIWTRLEVACKLLDMPVVVALAARQLLSRPDLALATYTGERLTFSVGVLRDEAGSPRRRALVEPAGALLRRCPEASVAPAP